MSSLACRVLPLLALASLAGCHVDRTVSDGGVDMGVAACMVDAGAHCLVVDDAGVSHGCNTGGMGPGDRDDGGGLPNAPPPDAAVDAMNQPFGAECLDNAQCASNICFLYRVKGQFCTQLCACDSDCPPPSLGCGGQGVCRVGD